MTENRSRMSEELFNHRKNIVNGMQFFQNDLENFVPSKELLLKSKLARQAHIEKVEKAKQDQKDQEQKLSARKAEVEEQKNLIRKKREATEELTNLITSQLKKLKEDSPQVACLKIMAAQREKLIDEEANEQKKLDAIKAKN